jgi:hypothetical protein
VIRGKIGKLNLWVSFDLGRLVIGSQICHKDREILFYSDGGNWTDARMALFINRSEHGKFRVLDHGMSEFRERICIDGVRFWFHGLVAGRYSVEILDDPCPDYDTGSFRCSS